LQFRRRLPRLRIADSSSVAAGSSFSETMMTTIGATGAAGTAAGAETAAGATTIGGVAARS
jgi:hypothetical protein